MCTCPPTRGQIINQRAWLMSQIIGVRAQVLELEKTARKTPPKTLVSERMKVDQAKLLAPAMREHLAKLEHELATLSESEGKDG
jgi:hypothetical protein